mgnify:CR=1 FL=1
MPGFSHYRRSLTSSRFVRNVGLLAVGTVVAKSVGVVSAPLLTRFYAPEDFGALAGVLAIGIVLSALGTLQFYQAIPLPPELREAVALKNLSLLSTAVVTTGVALLVFTCGDRALEMSSLQALSGYFFLVPIVLFFLCVHDVLNWWAIRNKAFKKLSCASFVQGLSASCFQLALGATGIGAAGLIGGDILGRFASTLPLVELRSRNLVVDWRCSMRDIVSAAAKYWRFAVLITPSNVLNRLTNRLPVLVLLTFYGPAVAGWFALSDLVLRTPISLLGASIGKAYLAEVAERRRTGKGSIRTLLQKTTLTLAIIGLPPLLLILFAGHHVFRFAFGADWIWAGHFARLLAIGMYVKLIASTVSQTLHVLQKQHVQFFWDLASHAAIVGAFCTAIVFGWSFSGAVAVYSASLTASYLAYLLLIWRSAIAGDNRADEKVEIQSLKAA